MDSPKRRRTWPGAPTAGRVAAGACRSTTWIARAPTVSDAAALATALRRRLAADRALRARARRAWSFAAAAAAAAAIVIAVLTGRDAGPRSGRPYGRRGAGAAAGAGGAGDRSSSIRCCSRWTGRSPARSTLDASTLGEYEDGELEQVFATWEG